MPTSRRASRREEVPPPDEAVVVPEADPEGFARKILLDQLTGRARTRHELAAKLAGKHVPDEIATRLLDRFEEVGLIDDAAFAAEWVQSRRVSRGLARRALGAELHRKGVDPAHVAAAVDSVDPDDEVETARSLVRKRMRSLARFDTATQTRRLTGMLARKGYPASVTFAVVREELRLEAEGDLLDPSAGAP